MAKINVQADCGNAPRKLFLKAFMVAMANGDMGFFAENIQKSISWEVVGHSNITGKENYLKAISESEFWKLKELTIDTIITHGRDASASGQLIAEDDKVLAFCHIYRFTGASGTTLNFIKTFLIPQT